MAKFRFDPANTEGTYPTAIVIDDAELRKDDKAVATDLENLYDTEITDPLNGDLIIFDNGKWINSSNANICQICSDLGFGGSGCNIFEGYAYPEESDRPGYDGGDYLVEEDIYIKSGSLSLGIRHLVGITPENKCFVTGYNFDGQIGNAGKYDHELYYAERLDGAEVIDVSAGRYHTAVIKKNGTLWTTGKNGSGCLGLGHGTVTYGFTQVGTDTDWVSVWCGAEQTFAQKEDGTLWSCGDNSYGELGLGDWSDRYVLTQIGTDTDWVYVYAESSNAFAIKANGTLWGWGSNYSYVLGLGSSPAVRKTYPSPTQSGSHADWSFVIVYGSSAIAVKENGTAWGCGSNYNGVLGFGDDGGATKYYFTQIPNLSHVVDLHMNGNSTYFISEMGGTPALYGVGRSYNTIVCTPETVYPVYVYDITLISDAYWTNVQGHGPEIHVTNIDGRIHNFGHPNVINTSIYTWGVGEFPPITDRCNINTNISMKQVYTDDCLFIDADTAVENRNGSLDEPFASLQECFTYMRHKCAVIPEDKLITVVLLTDLNIQEFTSLNHNCGHRIVIEGANKTLTVTYDVGDGSTETETTLESLFLDGNHSLKEVKNINLDLQMIDSGVSYEDDGKVIYTHGNYAIKEDGTLWTTNGTVYAQVGTDTDWLKISQSNSWVYGEWSIMALKTDGTIWGYGYNDTNHLGLGSEAGDTIYDYTQEASLATDWIDVINLGDVSFALKTDGTLWACGKYDGCRGLGEFVGEVSLFTQEATYATDWIGMKLYFYNMSANGRVQIVKSNGTIWGSGLSVHGLGSNIPFTYVFTQEVTLTSWEKIICASNNIIALKEGEIYSTGGNVYGQLGTGDNVSLWTLTRESRNDTDWEAIHGNGDFCIAVKQDGTIWGTGRNERGLLGLGHTNNVNVYTQEITLKSWDVVEKFNYGAVFTRLLDNTIWVVGENSDGQLGLGDTVDRDEYTQLDSSTDWASFAMPATGYTVGLKENGTLWGTGKNTSGAIPTGALGYLTTFTPETNGYENLKIVHVSTMYALYLHEESGALFRSGETYTGSTNYEPFLNRLTGGITVDGQYILDLTIDYRSEYIELFNIHDNSSCAITNINTINPDAELCFSLIDTDYYLQTTINKVFISSKDSICTYSGTLPSLIVADECSTVVVKECLYDINDWIIKNNSTMIVEFDSLSTNINIENENSTLIIDGELQI